MSPTGEEMTQENWEDANTRCFGMLLDGRAQPTGIRKRGEETTLLVIFNSWQDVVKFTLPRSNGGAAWTLLADTNMPDSKRRAQLRGRPRLRDHGALAGAVQTGLSTPSCKPCQKHVEDAQQVTDIKWLAHGGMRRCHCRNRKSLFDYKSSGRLLLLRHGIRAGICSPGELICVQLSPIDSWSSVQQI